MTVFEVAVDIGVPSASSSLSAAVPVLYSDAKDWSGSASKSELEHIARSLSLTAAIEALAYKYMIIVWWYQIKIVRRP